MKVTKQTGPGASLLLHNEGSRSVEVIGELAQEGIRLMPGGSFEIDASVPLRMTFYDGGLQIDFGTTARPRSSGYDQPGRLGRP